MVFPSEYLAYFGQRDIRHITYQIHGPPAADKTPPGAFFLPLMASSDNSKYSQTVSMISLVDIRLIFGAGEEIF